MATKTTITLSRGKAGELSLPSTLSAREGIRRLANFLDAGVLGAYRLNSVAIRDASVAATGTITLASCAAGTVILINGVPFTAKGSAATAGNNEFDVSGNDSADATALAAAINASSSSGIAGVLSASATNAVVTATSLVPGLASNAIRIENLGVVATATVTCASAVNNNTVTINGVTLTGKTTVTDATQQWAVGTTDAACATNLAALINSTATNALVTKHVRALVRSNVVHLFSKYGGRGGNAITLASSGSTLAVSGARLAGGTVAEWEGAQATATVTISGADGGTYRATINGVNCDATGTNGDDSATATSLAVAINSSTDDLVRPLVKAAASAGVVTITSIHGGHQGNAITLAATGTGATASAVRLSSGAPPVTAVVPTTGALTGGSNSASVTYTL